MFSIDQFAKCPNCNSVSAYRSRRRGGVEFFLHYFLFTSPYRCKDCDYRYYLSRRAQQPIEKPSEHPHAA